MDADVVELRDEKAEVERHIVPDDDVLAQRTEELASDLVKPRCLGYTFVRETVYLAGADRLVGVDHRFEGYVGISSVDMEHSDLNDPVQPWLESSRLDIDDRERGCI